MFGPTLPFIEQVTAKVKDWFSHKVDSMKENTVENVGLQHMRIGILTPCNSKVSPKVAQCLAQISKFILGCGGMVVVPQNSQLTRNNNYLSEILDECSCSMNGSVGPNIAYGQSPSNLHGFYIMETPTDHWVETLTGIGASGIEILLCFVESDTNTRTLQGHPMIPLIKVTASNSGQYLEDFDLALKEQESNLWPRQIIQLLCQTASRQYVPKLSFNFDFQIARGVLGISM